MPFLKQFEFYSRTLGLVRRVTVFSPSADGVDPRHPTVFCTDGQGVGSFAKNLIRAISANQVPPVTLVGAHSHPASRSGEYLPGDNKALFHGHEKFFTEELTSWAGSEFGIQPNRVACGVFGCSNGGAFAMAMGARHPSRYGAVIAFSIASGPVRVAAPAQPARSKPRYYLSAGSLESAFLRNTTAARDVLRHNDFECEFTEQCEGHDPGFWCDELPRAIAWCFP